MRDGPFTGVDHLCVVTADLDAAVRAWSDGYGIGPWAIYTKDASNMSAEVDGAPEPFAMRAALCSLSPGFRLELIEPLEGRSPYSESLERHGGRDHVHHLRLEVADYGAASGHLAARGLEVPLDAWFDGAPAPEPRLRATYFDTTDELGVMLEIADVPPGFAMPEPDAVYPPPAEEAR